MHEAANPFADAIAVANSNYAALERGRLVHPASGEPVSALTAFVHDELRALVLNEHFTCMGGKAALRQGTYRFGFYGDMTSAAAARGLARDLFTFTGDMPALDGGFTTFLASFTGPNPPDEEAFERTLWRMRGKGLCPQQRRLEQRDEKHGSAQLADNAHVHHSTSTVSSISTAESPGN